MTSPEQQLVELGIQLPPPSVPKGAYRSVVVAGGLASTAGHLPTYPDGGLVVGKVGLQLDTQAGYEAARLAGLAILASVRAELGSLDRVKRLIKVLGLVNCPADFTDHPAVINGCSELFRDVFGADAGTGARSAVGVVSLPLGVAVEIEAVFEVLL
jgi:enamine deaminase RidA (YjgF/YER057c/UK114 family)